jgi:hypothetical protein
MPGLPLGDQQGMVYALAGRGGRVELVGSQAYEVGEGLDLAPAGLSEDLAEQSVTGPEVVDQHSVRRACGGGQRPKPVREPVLERVVGARVEEPLPDLWWRCLPIAQCFHVTIGTSMLLDSRSTHDEES